MIKINNQPLIFAEGDTSAQQVQKLNDFVNQVVNALTDTQAELEKLQKKIKRLEE